MPSRGACLPLASCLSADAHERRWRYAFGIIPAQCRRLSSPRRGIRAIYNLARESGHRPSVSLFFFNSCFFLKKTLFFFGAVVATIGMSWNPEGLSYAVAAAAAAAAEDPERRRPKLYACWYGAAGAVGDKTFV